MLLDLALYSQALENELASLRSTTSSRGEPAVVSTSLTTLDEDPPSRSDIDLDEALTDRLHGLSLNHYRGRHFGQSSHYMLLQSALDARDDLNGGQTEKISVYLKRSEFWDLKPWHIAQEYEPIPYEYPPDDLLESLVALYWEHYHYFYPLLHKPTFGKLLAARFHLYDRTFGSVVLAVCALASRHSDDPRVLYGDMTSKHSAGWKYFNQIEFILKSFVDSPTVYSLRVYPLAITFMHATHIAETSWVLIGHGIRLAQTIGVHQSGFGKGRDFKEVELWKRAFWQLILFDTASSMSLGRPRSCNTNDIDIEIPTICDNEYWETPNPDDVFKQPETTPSKLTFWIHYLKLMEIVGFAQRSITSRPMGTNDSFGCRMESEGVMELDSALNKWIDALPGFLKYDAHQSVMLYAAFYRTQISVHRLFIPRPGQNSILTFPSLAICANAARACVHLLDGHHRRYKIRLAHLMPPIFSCAVVLLINLWRGIQSKISLNVSQEMDKIQKCLDILALYEDRFEMAGRLRDILLSRTRSVHEGNSFPAESIEEEPTFRPNVGSQKTAQSQYDTSIAASLDSVNLNLNANRSLPVTSNDLGGMPVHIDVGSDMGTDMVASSDHKTYESENTLPNQRLDGMAYESNPVHESDIIEASTVGLIRDEWSQFMAEVDELLQLVDHPTAGQL
ncbi:hypothetical protein GYMLUDRAFT_248604 [Collybiopsis luxurians FD-317 M1]|uniref:Xylanolytic transcriptional activator regulatory domain-containing protein n=1 Tax=Collybiopsis luxurians FD-317 M1 TaxID=944289 RepID=A0A0D0CKG2_9AGAR|nr:hypothetical protein GYMLUDRAFT_248604 [Collybiopsis luxurians FD-317 M1]